MPPSSAQAPDWQWAKSYGGSDDDWGINSAIDLNGNYYVSGTFRSDSLVIDNSVLHNYNTLGYYDLFLAKFDSTGNLIWARSAGGKYSEAATSIAVDNAANVYITGNFADTVYFNIDTLVSPPFTDETFVAKYDSSGNIVWVRATGSAFNDNPKIAVDNACNVSVTGYFDTDSTQLGSTTFYNHSQSNTFDIYVFKYDSSGNFLWAKTFGGPDDDYAESITTDKNGNIFITGGFTTSATFDSIILQSFTADSSDIFLLKLIPSGAIEYLKSYGGIGDDGGSAIAVDSSGNCYLTGIFNSPAIQLGSNNFTNSGWLDMFVAKCDSSGNITWAASAGTAYDEYTNAINVDHSGNSYVLGTFGDSAITFGNTTLVSSNVPTFGGRELFVTKYDASGVPVWAKSAHGYSYPQGMCMNSDGATYITGTFGGTMLFGVNTITNTPGGYNFFISKLNADVLTGLESLDKQYSFSAYPNPANDVLNIYSEEENIKTVELITSQGQILFQQKLISTKSVVLNLSNYTAGLYFVKITGEKNTVVKKVMRL